MNIYLIYQDENTDYDTFDSCVIIAESEEQARLIHPGSNWSDPDTDWSDPDYTWASNPEAVKVELVGVALPGAVSRIICASFNAG